MNLEKNVEEEGNEVTDDTGLKAVNWLKKQYQYYQKFTQKGISDSVWLIALKYLIKGMMVLILIILSPFILFFLLFSLLIAA